MPSRSILFPYTTLFRSLFELFGKLIDGQAGIEYLKAVFFGHSIELLEQARLIIDETFEEVITEAHIHARFPVIEATALQHAGDRKTTRLNSSHANISYAL